MSSYSKIPNVLILQGMDRTLLLLEGVVLDYCEKVCCYDFAIKQELIIIWNQTKVYSCSSIVS